VNEAIGQYVQIGLAKIRVVSELKGKVRIGIRPEDIIIASERFSSSAQNTLNARIVKMIPRGHYVKVILDAGIVMTALITRRASEEMDLGIGSNVWAVFKTTAVHVF
jgi:molybdopterin-binding protein